MPVAGVEIKMYFLAACRLVRSSLSGGVYLHRWTHTTVP